MYQYRTNPPSRQIKPTPAYTPTFYPLPAVGDAIAPEKVFARSGEPTPWVAPVRMTNDQLLAGLARYLETRPAIDEGMLGRLFAKNSDLLAEMRDGLVLPNRVVQRMAAFIAREVANA